MARKGFLMNRRWDSTFAVGLIVVFLANLAALSAFGKELVWERTNDHMAGI